MIQRIQKLRIYCLFPILIVAILLSCNYYDPIKPDDLQRPLKRLPDPSYNGYTTLKFGNIIVQISLNDYVNACNRKVHYMDAPINKVDGFSNRIHYLSIGDLKAKIKDPIYLMAHIDPDEFTDDVRHLAFHSFKFQGSFTFSPEDFQLIPESIMDFDNQVVKITLDTLEFHFILGER